MGRERQPGRQVYQRGQQKEGLWLRAWEVTIKMGGGVDFYDLGLSFSYKGAFVQKYLLAVPSNIGAGKSFIQKTLKYFLL